MPVKQLRWVLLLVYRQLYETPGQARASIIPCSPPAGQVQVTGILKKDYMSPQITLSLSLSVLSVLCVALPNAHTSPLPHSASLPPWLCSSLSVSTPSPGLHSPPFHQIYLSYTSSVAWHDFSGGILAWAPSNIPLPGCGVHCTS